MTRNNAVIGLYVVARSVKNETTVYSLRRPGGHDIALVLSNEAWPQTTGLLDEAFFGGRYVTLTIALSDPSPEKEVVG